jgi:hypothetical protein
MKKYTILTISLLCSLSFFTQNPAVKSLPKAEITETTVAVDTTKNNQAFKSNKKKYIAVQRFLNGINTEVNYEKALALFADLAQQGDPQAINALAGMYRQGFGLPQPQPETARLLYKEAVNLGSGKAAYNLAQMYKAGQGGEQDFEKAFEYANQAWELGYQPASYMLGYLYMKGFGTAQDYAKAVEYFSTNTESNRPANLYFLGLCYVGGYGVAQDIEQGKKLIEQAAARGNDHAVEFIVQGRLAKYEKDQSRQPNYHNISNNADTTHLAGVWEGRILCYDWSKKSAVEERRLTLQLETNENGELSGLWIQNDTVSIAVQAHREDSVWVLENMQYLQSWDRTWDLQQLRLEVSRDSAGAFVLAGNLTQFSPQTMEPSSPLLLELRKVSIAPEEENNENEQGGIAAENLKNKLKVYPNPFDRDIEVHISLKQAQRLQIAVTDLYGKVLYTETADCHEGEQTRRIALPALIEGAYSISIKGRDVNLSTLLLRKP